MRFHETAVVAFSLGAILSSALAQQQGTPAPNCNYLPTDPEWPSSDKWAALNTTVGGRLISNVPLPEVCHVSGFDSPDCTNLQNLWNFPEPHLGSSASIMAPYFQNNSCSPFPGVDSGNCTLGNLAFYSINVTSAEDAIAGINFARENNIRLVIKNTGHDYLGRSTGKGALSLWMHNLKQTTLIEEYTNSYYSGKALRLGAGIEVFEADEAAHANNVQVVAGYCPTVGAVGGYTQGGGFGALSSSYGLAPDNTLEFEVVTAMGEHLVANETANPDLFWALRGGGGGAFALVLSLVTKAHEDGPIGGALLQLNHTQSDEFWQAITFFQQQQLVYNSLPGLTVPFQILQKTFAIHFVTWPGHSTDDILGVLAPFTTYLDQHNITYDLTTSQDTGFYNHYTRYESNLPFGIFTVNDVISGRFIPRETVEQNVTALTNLIRNILAADSRYIVGGVGTNVSHTRVGSQNTDNAVMPAWRDAAFYLFTEAAWNQTTPLGTLDDLYTNMNDVIRPQFRDLTPGGGCYMNENTFNNPTWKEDYFGANYDRLLEVKKKYDPNFFFYGRPGVGHEFSEETADGRICRKSNA